MDELTQEKIQAMSVIELSRSVVPLYSEVKDPVQREMITLFMVERARQLNMVSSFKKLLKVAADAEASLAKEYTRLHGKEALSGAVLTYGSNDKPEETIDNYLQILLTEERFATFRHNLFTQNSEITEDLKTKVWIDGDDSETIAYIQRAYHLYYEKMYYHAMRMLQRRRSYHPVRDYIDGLVWDGTPRITGFLTKWMGCADTPYIHEVSRLLFAGGIHRIFDPGCKVDNMIVFMGKRQGEGKTTMARWLAMNDSWYGELTDLEGNKGIENIQSVFICEVGEMLAMVKAKELESVKAYLTRQVDRYRAPYDRRIASYPRQCIFIGTTNREQFLTDKTGNRRYFPVHVNMEGTKLYKNKLAVQEDIRQCWAEARAKYDSDFTSSVQNPALAIVIKRMQQAATEDDYREDMIAEYLDAKKPGESVCIEELWSDALNMKYAMPTKSESGDLGLIMQKFEDWERADEKIRFGNYGWRRGWTKTGDEMPF